MSIRHAPLRCAHSKSIEVIKKDNTKAGEVGQEYNHIKNKKEMQRNGRVTCRKMHQGKMIFVISAGVSCFRCRSYAFTSLLGSAIFKKASKICPTFS